MIHNVLLIDKLDGEVLTRTRYYKIDFQEQHIQEFLQGYHDLLTTEGLAPDTPVFVGEHKVFHSPVGEDLMLIFATDGRDEDRTIQYKVREGGGRIATALRGNTMGYIRDNMEDILGELIFTRFKIAFVGSGGVGKSTLLRLLFGREPAPGGYIPTINVAVDSSETIQFGTFLVTIWDFAGQAVFQDLWEFYFHGSDVVFLVCDSSFRNVMQTKTLLRTIRKEAPGVPLIIIANKQDLPESMKADKIKRLLGAPTYAMVATDKTRRDEFIRLMLEVASKTVGIMLPDRPVSEMITVRRRTEEIEAPPAAGKIAAETGFEEVPYSEADGFKVEAMEEALANETELSEGTTTGDIESEAVPTGIAAPLVEPTRIMDLLLIIPQEGMFMIAYHINYSGTGIDTTAVASLISALDSFGGIDGAREDGAVGTDALETIEHEGNLVIVEKSEHFVLALIINNNNEEEEQRRIMASLLVDIEETYSDVWETWSGDLTIFEPSMFQVLNKLPLRPISLDYVPRAREAGRPVPFNNRDIGKAFVEVKAVIDGINSVGGVVRSLDLPRETIIGCLQIMEKFEWIDFKVDISPESHLKKRGEVDPDTQKAYGVVVVKFVELCDGTTSLQDVVKQLNVSLPAMKYVATKLVLDGVLEVVA